MLLGIDVGTTHCKAGLFEHDGTVLTLAHRSTPVRHDSHGTAYYDPDELWSAVAATIGECTQDTPSAAITAVGVASMAESGLLLDRATGAARTPVFPWFDQAAAPYAALIEQAADPYERFCATGQYPSFKSGLARLLWLRATDPNLLESATWLSAADYVVYRMTGVLATDPTLAARTYAFRIDQGVWDDVWLDHWELPAGLLPPVLPSGVPAGSVSTASGAVLGLRSGTPVAVAGHDHVCAALAAGVVEPGAVFDSMGTAETLIGTMTTRPLGLREYETKLSFGRHVVADRTYWLGGLSTSGGASEWLRAVLGEPPLPYDDFVALVDAAGPAPTGILFLPYLLGRGAPQPDLRAQGALVGLRPEHGRAQIAKAVLEGVAYEWEGLRRIAAGIADAPSTTLIAAGGGTRNRPWMQLKADLSGCRITVPRLDEATLWGAALVAGLGCGVYSNVAAVLSLVRAGKVETYEPDPAQHRAYRTVYEQDYQPLQQSLRTFWGRARQEGTAL